MDCKIIGQVLTMQHNTFVGSEGTNVDYYSCIMFDQHGFKDEDKVMVIKVDKTAIEKYDLKNKLNQFDGKFVQVNGILTTNDGSKVFKAIEFIAKQ